jgi:membrane protein YqaA with SNARE-associated domain
VAPLAVVWGFAEATVFFIVPDVLLTAIALRSLRSGLIACVLAVVGALGGGVSMYLWGAHDYERAAGVVEKVPAISVDLMHKVREQMRQEGPIAVTIGPFTGWPYKIYAVEAKRAGIALPAFAAITVPARLSRFLLLTLIAGLASRAVHGRMVWHWRYAVLAVIWVGVYVQYWTSMEW